MSSNNLDVDAIDCIMLSQDNAT